MNIVTHSGEFHTDEVYATALLTYLFNIEDENITRTRDPVIINNSEDNENTIIIDVGRKYNPDKLFFDHHQTEFNDSFSEDYNIPLSSCGLIWKHYGQDIVQTYLDRNNLSKDEFVIEDIYQQFYKRVVLSIDANDNGVKQLKHPEKVRYNFKYNPTLTEMVSLFNSNNDDDEKQMTQFLKARDLCSQMFQNQIGSIVSKYFEYQEGLDEFRKVLDESRNLEYMYFDNDNIYYDMYLNEFDKEKRYKFFICKRSNNNYRIYTRRKNSYSFEKVAPIISEDHAKELVGNDLVFVHKALFIGGCKTLETARKVVEASLRKHHTTKKRSMTYTAVGVSCVVGLLAVLYPFFRK